MKRTILTLLKIIGFVVGWGVITSLPMPEISDAALWRFVAELQPLVAVFLMTLLFWLLEKRDPELAPAPITGKGSLAGFLLGILWLGGAVLALWLMDTITFFGPRHISKLPIWILAGILNVLMQELLVRGYLYQLIKKEYNVWVAAIGTSGLFVAFHGTQVFQGGWLPFVTLLAASLLMTAAMEWTGSFAAPLLMHTLWNVVGGIVLNGVVLASDYPHVFDMKLRGYDLLTGGDAKLEGSLITLLLSVLIGGILCGLTIEKRKSKSSSAQDPDVPSA